MAKKKSAKKSSKVSAKKSAAKKTTDHSAEMDIIDLILRDHKPLWKLLKIMKSERATVTQKKAAFKEFAPALEAHAHPEGKTWYMDMKSEDELKQDGLEGDIEHDLADQLCSELKRTSDNDVFKAKAKVLAEFVEHHLEEEEEEMLPKFKRNSTTKERAALGEKYEKLRADYL